jgi:hypothetical protein
MRTSGSPTHNLPLQPGQRVAVVPFAAASGATIGYYGTVVRMERLSFWTHPASPNDWRK